MSTPCTDLLVRKDKISEAHLAESQLPGVDDLAPGQALLRIDSFALTANNISYALIGEAFRYWDFFPGEGAWGRIPAWGFADVIASTSDDVSVGERVYGFLPMSTHLLVEPGHANPFSFQDMAVHRQALSPIYNQYARTAADPAYSPEAEALISLFRPLFTTSFLIDDYLATNEFFGAESVILSSASSKTSIGLASQLSKRGDQVRVIGLTSESRLSFVQGLGCYDQVVAYDELESLPRSSAAFVDMAGNAKVLARLHRHFADALKASCRVGVTHWSAATPNKEALPGPEPELFFAPTHAQARMKAWGPAGFQARLGEAWGDFAPRARDWISVSHAHGPDAALRTYEEVLANRTQPGQGHIVSLGE